MVKHFPCHLTRHLSRIVIVSHMHSCRSYESDIYAINVLYFRYYRKGWKTSIVNAYEWMHCHHLGKTCFLIPPHFHNEGRHCNCQSKTCARKKNEREYGYSVVILLGTSSHTIVRAPFPSMLSCALSCTACRTCCSFTVFTYQLKL